MARKKGQLGAEEKRQKALEAIRAPVAHAALAKNNSYGQPEFARRGYYEDTPFTCVDCGVDQVWTAQQQKWWFEVAKGYAYSRAKRCRACRSQRRSGRAASKKP